MILLTISKLEIIKVEYKGNEDAHDYLDIISLGLIMSFKFLRSKLVVLC